MKSQHHIKEPGSAITHFIGMLMAIFAAVPLDQSLPRVQKLTAWWHPYRRRDRSVPQGIPLFPRQCPTRFRCWSSRQCRFRQAQAGIRPECPRCPPGWGWSRQTGFRFRFRRSAALQIPQFPPLC